MPLDSSDLLNIFSPVSLEICSIHKAIEKAKLRIKRFKSISLVYMPPFLMLNMSPKIFIGSVLLINRQLFSNIYNSLYLHCSMVFYDYYFNFFGRGFNTRTSLLLMEFSVRLQCLVLFFLNV